jgi:penicillin-binding protein 1A
MSLREALAYSRNAVTVSLVDHIGVERVINFARSLGIQSNLPENLSIALGSLSVSPLELTSAYSAFANGGQRVSPISIKYITDSSGRVLESNSPITEPVVSAESAFLITTMLEDVINYGTGTAVKALGRPAAGKTGTTNDYKDAWFVGYTPELLAGVWVGYDDMKPLGNKETGGRAAAPIWLRFMSAALSGKDITAFEPPEGLQKEDYQIENTTLPYTKGVD